MEQEISGISKFPEKRTTLRGEPKFSKRISGKFLFYSILNRNFRKFWSNGTCPSTCIFNLIYMSRQDEANSGLWFASQVGNA